MNKHILPYSEKLIESIGRGSVLLIKGRPTKAGRFLYVTTINGYAEIKPGIKMVFIGDTIYRVIHKGNGKFAGRKVSYKGEDGLKGVFNMKNPGRPSVVLNHNKTPFHWITLNHLDVGSALREIGTRLFSHELILESEGAPSESVESYLAKEVLKLLTGQPNILKLTKVEVIEGGEDLVTVSEENDESTISDYETSVELILNANPKDVPPEMVDKFDELGLFPFDLGLGVLGDDDLELFGLSKNGSDGLVFNVSYLTYAEVTHTYDPGDNWTPPSSDSDINDVDTMLNVDDPFMIDGDPIEIPKEVKMDVDIYNRMISGSDPEDLVSGLKSLIHGNVKKIGGIERSPELTAQLNSLHYNYNKAAIELNNNGLSEEDKKKWSKVDTIDITKLKNQVEDIIKNQRELEEIDKDPDQELTPEQVAKSNALFDTLNSILPQESQFSRKFKYANMNKATQQIDRINFQHARGVVNKLARELSKPEAKKLSLERELMSINYQKARNQIVGRSHPENLRFREERIGFFLNQDQ